MLSETRWKLPADIMKKRFLDAGIAWHLRWYFGIVTGSPFRRIIENFGNLASLTEKRLIIEIFYKWIIRFLLLENPPILEPK